MPTLADLKAERAAASADVTRIAGAMTRLDDLRRAVDDAQAELDDWDNRTGEAVAGWAANGCVNEPPDQPEGEDDAFGRQNLARRLNKSKVALQHAGVAQERLQDEHRQASARSAQISRQIESLVLTALQDEVENAIGAYNALIADSVVPALAKILAAAETFRDKAAPHQSAGRTEEARFYLGFVSRLQSTMEGRLPGMFGSLPLSSADLDRAKKLWVDRYAELTGVPAPPERSTQPIVAVIPPRLVPPPRPPFVQPINQTFVNGELVVPRAATGMRSER